MKKLLLLSTFVALMVGFLPLQAQRYLTEIFPSRTVIHDIEYAQNITVISGGPTMDTLRYDVYRPMNDTMQERPVVIMAHTGSFLPVPLNGQATGNRKDSAMVDICHKLAARGFVAIAMSYRLGWNPVSTVQEERTGTLLNAAYRGIQDARTMVRYLRNDYANGNQHNINPNKIIVGGMGTGGYIALGVGYLDSYDEINLAKFLDGQGNSFVDTAVSGDVEGKWTRALNIGHYTTQSSSAQFVFNMGGALGDISWMEAGEPPVASVHVPSDPFAPYGDGAVIVPTTGDFVVNVSGSQSVQLRAQTLGTNNSYAQNTYIDAVSMQAATVNGGLNGLFPFYVSGFQSAPWEYWDSTYWKNVPHPSGGNFHTVGLQTNPDMSRAKETAYLDSTLAFIVPRIVCALGLANCNLAIGQEEQLDPHAVTVFPNPSASSVNVRSESGNPLEAITVTDLSGRQVKVATGIRASEYRLDHADLSPGMYFLQIQTRKGVVTEKVLFN